MLSQTGHLPWDLAFGDLGSFLLPSSSLGTPPSGTIAIEDQFIPQECLKTLKFMVLPTVAAWFSSSSLLGAFKVLT